MFVFILVVAVFGIAFLFSLFIWLDPTESQPRSYDGSYSVDVGEAAKEVQKIGAYLTAITGGVLLLCCGWYFFYYQSDDMVANRESAQQKKDCENVSMAYVMSQNFVKRALKSPKSADFPPLRQVTSVAKGDCIFLVSAYVDAKNSFGVDLRTAYQAEIEYLPESKNWRMKKLNIDQ